MRLIAGTVKDVVALEVKGVPSWFIRGTHKDCHMGL